MLVLRPVAYLLLVGLLAGCSLYSYDYRLWPKAAASNTELKDEIGRASCRERV